jgi:predicted RNA-binding Zn-ribbon protein involved in translation (DUF1610 family)
MKVASPETLARLLSRRLAERGDPGRAITLEQLLEDVLDYAAVRGELGLAGKGEYDVAMLGLLTHRSLLQVDPAVAAAARRELESPEPGLGFSKTFSDHLLRLRPGSAPERSESDVSPDGDEASEPDTASEESAVQEAPLAEEPSEATDVEVEPLEPEAAEPIAEPEPVAESGPVAEPEVAEPATEPEPVVEPEVAEPVAEPRCWACAAEMPPGDGMRYCPHCGTDQAARRCASCGERLEGGWRFCPRCGRGLEAPR